MKIEDVINSRFSLALGKAGVVGMREKRSGREYRDPFEDPRRNTVVDGDRMKCASCGQTTDRKYWHEYKDGDGNHRAQCSYCNRTYTVDPLASRRAGTHIPDLLALGDGRGTLRCPACEYKAGLHAFGGIGRPVCPNCGHTGDVVTRSGINLSRDMSLDEMDRHL